jgi:aromatic ring-opening dioxygenase LigB subunit
MEAAPLRAAVLMCHAPIVIPDIGGSRSAECNQTTSARAEAGKVLVDSGAQTIVVLSPHAPRNRHAFGYYGGKLLKGDFRNFGIYNLERSFTLDTRACEALSRTCLETRIPLEPLGELPMDHGAFVPLFFLAEAGYQGKLVVLGFPWECTPQLRHAFGRSIVEAMNSLSQPWALLASGDMSHRLQRGAPAGYHPKAHEFDEALVNLVKTQRYGETSSIDPELREIAAEDVVDSLDIASAILDGARKNARFLHYEGPFGVGYMEAVLHQEANS